MPLIVRVSTRPKVETEKVEHTPFKSELRLIKRGERRENTQTIQSAKTPSFESVVRNIQPKLGISTESWRNSQDRAWDNLDNFLRS